ncbi:hypothetical protein RB195_023201 [Necator americanus]|uniref:Uncharacterized protein n=1 Tax=Necator americanus TaxID=51031 RepID=A0ABR1EIU5_NECAM
MAVFDSVGLSRLGLVCEVGVSVCQASEPALDSPDGSGAIAQSAVDVAGCCRCSNAATPSIEDDNSKLFFVIDIVIKVKEGPLAIYTYCVEGVRMFYIYNMLQHGFRLKM